MKMFRFLLVAILPVLVFLTTADFMVSAKSDQPGECFDSWTDTSTNNTPTGRDSHTAVWTGDEMIVWGGFDIHAAATGGRYNPITDSWAGTNTTNAPSARWQHTAVWTGSEMIVWGGFGSEWFNSGGRYNPSTDTWAVTSTTNAPSPGTCTLGCGRAVK